MKVKLFALCLALSINAIIASDTVTSASPSAAASENPTKKSASVNDNFIDQFTEISCDELDDNTFQLVGKDFTIITAGKSAPNSMTAGWGGFGILFNKPTAWLFLRANRFTLEKIRQDGEFTLSYFSDEHKDDVLFFGSKSGRDSDKMQTSKLTPIRTPDDLPTYAEARLIFECKLVEITTVSPDDFLTDDGKKFINEGFNDAKDYHKMVFGEIIKVWKKNDDWR